jgi:hypothetical protein
VLVDYVGPPAAATARVVFLTSTPGDGWIDGRGRFLCAILTASGGDTGSAYHRPG